MFVSLPRPSRAGLALAVGSILIAQLERFGPNNILPGRAPAGWDAVLVLVPVLPLAWHRIAPFRVAIAMALLFTVTVAGLGGTLCFFGGLFAFLVPIYSASELEQHPWDRLIWLVALAFFAPMPLYVGARFDFPSDFFLVAVATLAAWLAGQGVRRWRTQSEALADTLRQLQDAHGAQEQLALAGERARLARELHDVVAHSLSVMVLQAQAARLDLVDGHPDTADVAINRVETTGRDALIEMRRLLGVLRSAPDAALEPQPGLAALPQLISNLGQAGLVTQVAGPGAGPLTAGVDLTAYRVVQEALTNALRYGDPPEAHLLIGGEGGRLHIRVTNPCSGRCPNLRGGGHGLLGLAERVALFEGEVTYGPDGSGQFIVDVGLPLVGDP